MNKKTALLLLILSMIFTGVTGCESKEDDKKITLSDNEYMLYYGIRKAGSEYAGAFNRG